MPLSQQGGQPLPRKHTKNICPECGNYKVSCAKRCWACHARPRPYAPQGRRIWTGMICPICGGPKEGRSKTCFACRYQRPQIQQPPDTNIRHIALTRGQIGIIDASEYPRVIEMTWLALWYKRADCYYIVSGTGVKLHRFIMNAEPGQEVDHINHNPLDNRKVNLRFATRREQVHNRRRSKRNTSGYIGVSWSPECSKWRAYVGLYGQRFYLGVFVDILDAARARDEKAIELHGEFAVLNFPRSDYL